MIYSFKRLNSIYSYYKILLHSPFCCWGVWDLFFSPQLWHVGSSSLTRDQTCTPCIGSVESQPLDHQRSPILVDYFVPTSLYLLISYPLIALPLPISLTASLFSISVILNTQHYSLNISLCHQRCFLNNILNGYVSCSIVYGLYPLFYDTILVYLRFIYCFMTLFCNVNNAMVTMFVNPCILSPAA